MNRKKGQSLIEFTMVVAIFVFMISLSYNAVVGFTVYQYMSYVTFMTARSLQSSASNPQAQNIAACKTLISLLPSLSESDCSGGGSEIPIAFPSLNLNLGIIKKVFIPDATNLEIGVTRTRGGATDVGAGTSEIYLEFSVPFITFPFSAELANFKSISLVAKSALGREVTQEECKKYFENFYNYYLPGGIKSNLFIKNSWQGMDDNGC